MNGCFIAAFADKTCGLGVAFLAAVWSRSELLGGFYKAYHASFYRYIVRLPIIHATGGAASPAAG